MTAVAAKTGTVKDYSQCFLPHPADITLHGKPTEVEPAFIFTLGCLEAEDFVQAVLSFHKTHKMSTWMAIELKGFWEWFAAHQKDVFEQDGNKPDKIGALVTKYCKRAMEGMHELVKSELVVRSVDGTQLWFSAKLADALCGKVQLTPLQSPFDDWH